MKTLKITATLIVLILIAAACSHAEEGNSESAPAAPASSPSNVDCDSATLEATEIGVSATEIQVQVMADVQSPLSPGLFQGAFDGTKAWADYINEQGGLACRRIKLVEFDSILNPVQTTNGFLKACDESLALVGSNALFALNVEALQTCEDQAGNPIGIPDFAEGAAEIAHQCTANVFLILGIQGDCPYTNGERLYEIQTALGNYLTREFGTQRCAYVYSHDLPSVINLSLPGIRAASVFRDTVNVGEQGVSGASPQAAFGTIIATMKNENATCGNNSSDSNTLLKWRGEAVAQGGLEDVIWSCFYQCYTDVTRKDSLAEGTYMWLPFLPYEERDVNPELDLFFNRVNKNFPDVWAALSWGAARLFQTVIESVVEKHGVNGITRQNILNEARQLQDFNANGWFGDISFGGRPNISSCTVIVQVKNKEFVRVHPKERGTFDCAPESKMQLIIDPVRAFNDGPSYTGRLP